MRYKSIALPAPSEGLSFKGIKSIVVPEQGFSLQEILERFTRGESMEVEHEGVFDHESDIDLEKMKFADLVDKEEFKEKQLEIASKFEREQKAREKKKREKYEADQKEAEEKRIEEQAEKRAQEILSKSAK